VREFGTCKGCGAELEWALLNGKTHPFDVDPTTRARYEPNERDGRMVATYRNPLGAVPEGTRLVSSHFSTCPNAKDFRGR
jgi:hypothetical protein